MAYFNTNQRVSRTTDSLFSIRQQDRESLCDFVACFNTATLEVKDLDEATAITTMKRGLWNSRFIYSLDKMLPQSYVKLLKRAQKYNRIEEAATNRRQFEGKGPKKKARKGGVFGELSRIRTEKEAPPF